MSELVNPDALTPPDEETPPAESEEEEVKDIPLSVDERYDPIKTSVGQQATGQVDFSFGSEGDSCKEVDGKIVCGSYGYDQGAAADSASGEDREKKPIALVLADLIQGARDARQKSLTSRMENVGKRRELYSKDKQFGIRNPFARARYKSLQRRLARSEGREEAGEGIQRIEASF